MKKRIVLSGLLAAALTLSLTACGGDEMPEETPVPTPIQTSTPVPTPTPTPAPAAPKSGDQVFAKTFTSGDGATVLTASFTLPLIQNTDACPAGAAINEWYKAEGASRMLEAEEAYEMAVADYDVSKAAGFPFYPTTQEMTYQIAYADEKVISVCRDLYVSSEGEAHPAVFLLSEQFDAVMGEKLDFTDFFTDADAVRARVVDALFRPAERAGRGGGAGDAHPGRHHRRGAGGQLLLHGGGVCVLAPGRRPARHEQPALCGADL